MKYKANGTMKILAKQDIAEVTDIAPDIEKKIRDIMTANGIPIDFIGSKMFGMGIDIILYGVMLGKRLERQRNKHKYGLNADQRNYIKIILEDIMNENQKGGIIDEWQKRI